MVYEQLTLRYMLCIAIVTQDNAHLSHTCASTLVSMTAISCVMHAKPEGTEYKLMGSVV